MSNSETRAGAAAPANGAGQAMEVKTVLAGFLSDFNNFQADIKGRLQKQEDRMTMIDRKTMNFSGRPALSRAATMEAPHQKAFSAYLRSGDDDGLRGLELEGKGLNVAIAAEGGYLVDPQTAEIVVSVLKSSASIRSVANVVHVDANAFDVLIDHTDIGAGWATESGSQAETATPQIDRISIPLHELSALPKASQRLLDDSAFDVENWIATRIADKFSRSEGASFVSGDGIDKPKGFLTYDSAANGTEAWGEFGHITTGVDGDFATTNPADAIVDLVYALGARYRANANFVMNSKTAGAVRKMKDADGRFLWSDGLAAGEPARLMGYPVLVCEDMPDIATWAPAIAFGDFRAGYTIAERPDLRILRDPFSAKPHVLFYATKRIGGDVSDFHAIKLLKFAMA
ncbi:MAG: phage major capsid protein [Rhodobacteraceae bacterium]|nr:phage major capsid protein [Paracoccaceae bacterium]